MVENNYPGYQNNLVSADSFAYCDKTVNTNSGIGINYRQNRKKRKQFNSSNVACLYAFLFNHELLNIYEETGKLVYQMFLLAGK